jgi:hypothetical protein
MENIIRGPYHHPRTLSTNRNVGKSKDDSLRHIATAHYYVSNRGREGKGCKRKKSGESADDESMPIKTGRRQSESVDMSMNPSAGQINHSTFEDLLLSDRKRESN